MAWKWICCCLLWPLVSFSDSKSVYGQRYCEIVSSSNYADFNVYNTYGLNDCPKHWWSGLKDQFIQKKYHFRFVHLNGPRIWLIDGISKDYSQSSIENIEGQRLRKVASFHPDFSSIIKRHGPYTDYLIEKDHEFQFNKGRLVYELINPKGQVYVLHSISLKHYNQTPANLNHLMHNLKLPQGWHIKQGIISDAKVLKPISRQIHVIQDDYENTYQLTQKDFL